MSEAYILGGARTPIGIILGSLSSLKATQLGGTAIKAAVERSGVSPDAVDEVIMGHVVQAGCGQNPARQAAVEGGLPPSVSAFTINKVCGSGLKATMLAANTVRVGEADVVVAGGMESMSWAPHAANVRAGKKYGPLTMADTMIVDGLWCAFNDVHMGELAEYTAEKAGVSREEQDELALASHRKAVDATREGRFKEEIVPVTIKTRKGETVVTEDEGPRPDTSAERLAKLRPAFKRDGTVTAGNAPGLNDAGAALVVASEKGVKASGASPLARITAYTYAHTEPKDLFFAPVQAVKKLYERTGTEDYDLMEVNEAFAAQVLADHRELRWDWERYNVNGGAIALGHPIGASGARILLTLVAALKARGKRRGLAALCLGGGGAVAMAVEAL